jgi:sulfur-carrier protein adenylyltransferase/sulfurtransferase
MFSHEEFERYNRHLILPEIGLEGQKKLKQARVLVIGAGGLGCPILQYLAAAGVGTIGICDFDTVDASNLQRQILYTISDLGKPKAIAASRKIQQINPYVDIETHNLMLTKDNVLDIFAQYDIVVDGSDNFPTRFLINDACVILGKPLVFGAIYKFEGQVSVFNYKGGPTYRCLVPEEPEAAEAPSCSQIGVIGAIPGLIGCYQAIETIKIICGTGNVLSGKMLMVDLLNMQQCFIEIARNESMAVIKELGNYGNFCSTRSPDIEELSPEELFGLVLKQDVLVVDIRDKETYDQFHITSTNIPANALLAKPELIAGKQTVVFVCEIGINSRNIIESLKKAEIGGKFYNLKGGIQAWISNGYPFFQQ